MPVSRGTQTRLAAGVVFVASAGLLVYRTVALAKVLSANAKVPLPPGLAPFHEWSHPQPTPRSSADAR